MKNQLSWGSCWAFSSIGALEGQMAVHGFNKTGGVSLSPQVLVDCSKSNYGCQGGTMGPAFDIMAFGGVETEEDYPSDAYQNECKVKKEKVVITDSGHHALSFYGKATLKEVVAKFGPVSIAFEATNSFWDYKSGVFQDGDCDSMLSLIHAVLVVGYGTDPVGGDYWIVKNSSGPEWGEQGYFKIKRGVYMCSVGHYSIIPKF